MCVILSLSPSLSQRLLCLQEQAFQAWALGVGGQVGSALVGTISHFVGQLEESQVARWVSLFLR